MSFSTKRRRKKSVEVGKYGLYFVTPFFIIFFIFQFYPLLNTIYNSLVFTYKNGRNVISQPGLSFGNYSTYVFGSAGGGEFWQAMGVTIAMWLINFVPQLFVSLLFAAWFTDTVNKIKGVKAYKVIMYMPNIVTAATVSVLFYNMFYGHGPIAELVSMMGGAIDINKGWTSMLIIAFIQFWMWYGNTMLILMSGIMGISPSYYEAARVDGATSMQQFWKITVPLLKPVLQFTLVTSLIGGLQMFDVPYLFNDGGPVVCVGDTPVQSTRTIVMLIKKYVSPGEAQNIGKAASYSVALFVITLILSLVFVRITNKKQRRAWRY